MKRLCGLCVALILLSCNTLPAADGQAPAAQELSPEIRALVERLDAQAAKEFAKDSFASVTIGVVSGDDLVWTRSYGWADNEKKIPATSQTLYRIGSITKEFTALMLLQARPGRKVIFPIRWRSTSRRSTKSRGGFRTRLPSRSSSWRPIRRGLDREPGDTETYLKGPVSDWEKVLIAALPQTRYAHEPGMRYSYSNIGYAILGAALSRAAGQPYVRLCGPAYLQASGNDELRLRAERPDSIEDLERLYQREGKIDAETAERQHQGAATRCRMVRSIQRSKTWRDSSLFRWERKRPPC